MHNLKQKIVLLKKNMKHGSRKILLSLIIFIFCFSSLEADPIEGQTVHLKILDKITAQIETIKIDVNDIYRYGTLKIAIYACYKRPPEEIPEDFVLLRIFDMIKKNTPENIFQGWMLSSSPAATPFEHPIYDVWVKNCEID